MTELSPLTGLLTISRRAGKLLLGFDAVKEGLQGGTVCCVMLAADCSPKTAKEIRFFAKEVPVIPLPLSGTELAAYFRKRTAVLGLTEQGFARKLCGMFPDAANEQNVPAPAGAGASTQAVQAATTE